MPATSAAVAVFATQLDLQASIDGHDWSGRMWVTDIWKKSGIRRNWRMVERVFSRPDEDPQLPDAIRSLQAWRKPASARRSPRPLASRDVRQLSLRPLPARPGRAAAQSGWRAGRDQRPLSRRADAAGARAGQAGFQGSFPRRGVARRSGHRRGADPVHQERFAGSSATMPRGPRFIETVPKHGYRFIAPVERRDGVQARRGRQCATTVWQRDFVLLGGGRDDRRRTGRPDRRPHLRLRGRVAAARSRAWARCPCCSCWCA